MQNVKQNQKPRSRFVSLAGILLMLSILVNVKANVSEETLSSMPVKEITIFKDGHAFVLHEAEMPTDTDGNVVIDSLPRPIMGTFWAYSADDGAELTGVISQQCIVPIKRTTLTIPELIEGNIGAKVRVTEAGLAAYESTIVGIPTRSSEELRHSNPPGSPAMLPQRGGIVLLKFEGGVKAVPINRIQEVTFLDEARLQLAGEEFRERMTLKLNWGKRESERSANVGMVYVQRGIRWIPNYRVDIDGKGNAVVKLQATIINELTDVENVNAHLVIGVPKFAFENTPDPIRWDNASYARSNLTGTIHLINHRSDTVHLEIRRSILGHIDSASHAGSIEHLGRHESGWMAPNSLPFWWSWYNWPYWWYHFNAVGRVTWKCELNPEEVIELEYQWHYFWRR